MQVMELNSRDFVMKNCICRKTSVNFSKIFPYRIRKQSKQLNQPNWIQPLERSAKMPSDFTCGKWMVIERKPFHVNSSESSLMTAHTFFMWPPPRVVRMSLRKPLLVDVKCFLIRKNLNKMFFQEP